MIELLIKMQLDPKELQERLNAKTQSLLDRNRFLQDHLRDTEQLLKEYKSEEPQAKCELSEARKRASLNSEHSKEVQKAETKLETIRSLIISFEESVESLKAEVEESKQNCFQHFEALRLILEDQV